MAQYLLVKQMKSEWRNFTNAWLSKFEYGQQLRQFLISRMVYLSHLIFILDVLSISVVSWNTE